MKIGKRWVTVEETPEDRKARRARALLDVMDVEHQHAAVLLGELRGDMDDGFLKGEEADAARAEILKRIIS